jgi:NADH:ubiquinone oxidoreductase subunit F (NADH-binding)
MSALLHREHELHLSPGHRAPEGLPRLLLGIPEEGASGLSEHLEIHGPAPFAHRRERRGAGALIDEIEKAGLGGRGGAGFPTARKMRAVAGSRGRPVVVVNAAEGEPTSLKDKTLLQTLPHIVLDGAVLAARALGGSEVIVCVADSADLAIGSTERAILERREAGGEEPGIHVATVPDRYVSGQESALVSHLNGGPALPTFTPPMPYERGVGRRPTLINNAETIAHVALIARHGARWFRELGTPTQPGSTLVTLSGPVAWPGVYEIEHGASLASLIDAAGGKTAPVRAALIGGYAGAWVGAEGLAGLELSNESLGRYGASTGAGAVVLLSEETCGVAETVRVARWMADQGAGQCGPCVHGLDAIANLLEEVAAGAARGKARTRLEHLLGLVRRRGACAHPDGAARLIASAVEVFAKDFGEHARHGACEACRNPGELPLPSGASRGRTRTAVPG